MPSRLDSYPIAVWIAALWCGAGLGMTGCDPARATDHAAQAKLCTPERDPIDFCAAAKLATSLAALTLAREQLPEAAGLIRVQSSPAGSLTVDGRSPVWTFWFVDGAADDALIVSVTELVAAAPQRLPREPTCTMDALIDALDSEHTVRDAVRRYERRHGTFVHGRANLFLTQDGCRASGRPEAHEVTFLHRSATDADAGAQVYSFARYWDDGRFMELVGPCASVDLEACLMGSEE